MMSPRKLFLILASGSVLLIGLYFYIMIEDFQPTTDNTLSSQTLLLQALNGESELITLARLNIKQDEITLSGFSAGASMANQMHVAHSSIFSGAAIFSQVFYRCGPKNILHFGLQCSKYVPQWFPYKVKYSIEDAKNYGEKGLIDPLENLRTNKVYIWVGNNDEYIPVDLAKQNKEFYTSFIGSPEQIQLDVDQEAAHLFPTSNFGGPCNADASKKYYLGNCNYSGAYNALHFLLGPSIQKEEKISFYDKASLKVYNQSEFYNYGNIKDAAMGPYGFVYIPKACQGADASTEQKCYLHINFHGCNEYPLDIAKKYIEHNQFLPLAEKNNIIVLFPLTTKISSNMDGCWDFYSYTGSEFATKKGKQIQIIRNIVQRLVWGKEEQLLVDK